MYCSVNIFFFFNDTATTEIYTLSLHDALPIPSLSLIRRELGRNARGGRGVRVLEARWSLGYTRKRGTQSRGAWRVRRRSEEHTSELQSRQYLVCRLLLEKKKKQL